MKNSKIIVLTTIFMLFLSSMIFSTIAINEKTLIQSIVEGKDFTNITPYPISLSEGLEIYPFFITYSNDIVWLLSGLYQTNWSDLERGVYLSDSLPYVTGFMGGYDADTLKVVSGAYFFNPYLTEEEFLRQKDTSFDRNSDRYRSKTGYSEPSKALFIHRVELILFEKLRLSLNELKLVGGKYPDLSDANPFGIFHNTLGEGYSNSMLGIDFSLIPIKGWQLYGQLAVDDFLVPETESGAEDYKPTALAWGLGTRFVKKFDKLYISPKFEYYKIYTWMYNQWLPYLRYTAKYNSREIPIGFDYGNDMEGFLVGIDIFSNNVKYKFIIERYLKGEIDLETPYDDERKKEKENWSGPYGNTIPFFSISFSFEIEI
ncbi:hypothetical protein [Defluviitoga tunisiensis]|uniref:Uncharacterized protein n=1 Tax=Defluviitoga tunisiensis TaxID=1006576 RepID=A0A0C7NTE8_DEFTU|nr:hypothetical protein [Defluviitoga tunisiensis]CEP79042.1 hypothetical protein DTL3_1757 [Defluviitoga tunisiensis]